MIEFRDIPERVEVPRDGLDRPLVIPPGGGKPMALTRTTTFIDCIEDKTNLADWGKRSVLTGVGADPSILDALRELDEEFERLTPEWKRCADALAERAMQAAGANDKREKGTYLHALSELVDAGIPLPDHVSDEDKADMAAYAMETQDLSFSHAETFVVVPELGVGGTPDRICHYDGPGPLGKRIKGDFIFDLKTGTVDYGGLKMASQLAIYSRAKFYDHTRFPAPPYARSVTKTADPEGFEAHKRWKEWLSTEVAAEEAALAYTPIPPVNQKWGIIFNLPSGTADGGLYWADLTIGWKAAKLAAVIRETRGLQRKALMPFLGAVA